MLCAYIYTDYTYWLTHVNQSNSKTLAAQVAIAVPWYRRLAQHPPPTSHRRNWSRCRLNRWWAVGDAYHQVMAVKRWRDIVGKCTAFIHAWEIETHASRIGWDDIFQTCSRDFPEFQLFSIFLGGCTHHLLATAPWWSCARPPLGLPQQPQRSPNALA